MIITGVSHVSQHVSCEPDVVHILDMCQPRKATNSSQLLMAGQSSSSQLVLAGQPASSSQLLMVGQSSSSQPRSAGQPRHTTTTTIIDNRPLTIQTFKLEPGMQLDARGNILSSATSTTSTSSSSSSTPACTKIKLEPGLLQTLPPEATPLKVEIQDNYLDSGQSQIQCLS